METMFGSRQYIPAVTESAVLIGIVKRVKKRRKELNLTQVQLAEKSGVSYASLRRFESTGEISFRSLLKIAESLDCLMEFNDLFRKTNK